MIKQWILLLALIFPCAISAADENAAADEVRTVAVLDFDFIDSQYSHMENFGKEQLALIERQAERVRREDGARLDRTVEQIRRELDALPQFEVVDTQPAAALIEKLKDRHQYLHSCNGCELKIGKALGADLVLAGWLQKVSNLILNVNAVLREVETGVDLAGGSVDMRGNTDESWSRAASRLVNDNLMVSYRATQKKANARHGKFSQ